jgi:CubicO group peptidase (beta-lactamase class C family)
MYKLPFFPTLCLCTFLLPACGDEPTSDPSDETSENETSGDETGSSESNEASSSSESSGDGDEGGDGDGDGEGDGACAASLGPENAELDAEIEALLSMNHHPGVAVCTFKGGTVTWCRGYGKANLELDRDVDAQTPFLLASVSKLFAATALMQAYEADAFELDDEVDAFTDFPSAHPSASTPISYRMLLAHVSSLVDSNQLDNWYEYGNVDPSLSLYDAVSGYVDPSGQFYEAANWSSSEPGTSYEYSNIGYAFVGLLAELHADMDFAELTRANIFEPLGMLDSSWRVADFDLDDVAMPYEYAGGSYSALQHYTFSDYPNGGLRASVCDVALFMASQAGGGAPILQGETLELMQEVAYPALDDVQGLGWYYEDIGPGDWIGHSGGEQGTFSDAFYRLSDGVGFVLLTNAEGDDENAIFDVEDSLIAWAESF